jgi:hypothetical protein
MMNKERVANKEEKYCELQVNDEQIVSKEVNYRVKNCG